MSRPPTLVELAVADALRASLLEWHGAEPDLSEALDHTLAVFKALRLFNMKALDNGHAAPELRGAPGDIWNAVLNAASPPNN